MYEMLAWGFLCGTVLLYVMLFYLWATNRSD